METGTSSEKQRVLVVDDNRDAADTLAMMLKLTGYETRACYSGTEGVATAELYQPMAIVLDIGMPDITGYEACRQIRETAWGQSPLIIALTGYGADEDRFKSTQAGFDAHLLKPVDLSELSRLLKERQSSLA
ncbi:response regulator [Dyadobacter crusticola]|uniref:response regulator n=1 Tax=Dyadobacter crusticola TaxID=292407 RepID=UPI00068A05A5|nr:response regulator [Dyadobacter crusticola]